MRKMMSVCLGAGFLALAAIPGAVHAFNPQPDPPGRIRATEKGFGGTVMISEENGKVKTKKSGTIMIGGETGKAAHQKRRH